MSKTTRERLGQDDAQILRLAVTDLDDLRGALADSIGELEVAV